MQSSRIISSGALAFAGILGGCVGGTTTTDQLASELGNVHGAIFTTTVDGSRVNANLYAAKTDVYLDGGPPANAPVHAAALPPGDYFFQVTDPSGKTLLSEDHISCRRFHINDFGVIDRVYRGSNFVLVSGVWTPGACQHATGIDQDHAEDGAITVQLMPYADTPNPGGEYKAWVTPVARYGGDPAFVPGPGDISLDDVGDTGRDVHGFIHGYSKTDNFKVRNVIVPTPPPTPPPVCGNGIVETGEQCDDGNTTDGDGCSSTCQIETPVCTGTALTTDGV